MYILCIWTTTFWSYITSRWEIAGCACLLHRFTTLDGKVTAQWARLPQANFPTYESSVPSRWRYFFHGQCLNEGIWREIISRAAMTLSEIYSCDANLSTGQSQQDYVTKHALPSACSWNCSILSVFPWMWMVNWDNSSSIETFGPRRPGENPLLCTAYGPNYYWLPFQMIGACAILRS
jgi:hypothetical protein